MKIGLVGGSNQERSLPFDAQRTINLYAASDPQGKEASALYGTPGLQLFSTCGVGTVRGAYAPANGRAFVVSGSGLYEIESNGTSTLRGTLDTSSGIVSIDENGVQLGICDGTYVYIFTYASNAFAKVTDVDLPTAGTITFIDGYFVISKVDTGSFYISALYDGTSWAALDFATAESSPDELLRVYNAVGQLWLFGTHTTEIWTNTGAASFPFERISGAKMEVGIIAPHTAIAVDNSIFWVGQTDIGSGIVYRANGFSPTRISTSPIEKRIQACPTPETLSAYTYQQEGHTFYVITGGGMETTLVYDISTQLWHERAYLNASGELELHLGACGMYAFSKQLVGSRLNGKVYEMSLDYYSDDGEEILSQRTFTHLYDEGKRNKASQLQVDFEQGTDTVTEYGSYVAIGSSIANHYDTLSSDPVLAFNLLSVLWITDSLSSSLAAGDNVKYSGSTDVANYTAAEINTIHTVASASVVTTVINMSHAGNSVVSGGGASVIRSCGLLTITSTAHGLSNGDTVEISGAIAVGGITADQINGQFVVRNVTANTFDIMTSGYSTSSVSAGGGTAAVYRRVYPSRAAVAWLEISRDGGRTWSDQYSASLGSIGEYRTRAVWRRLGIASQWTFRLSVTDPVKRAICGAYLT